MLLADTLGLSKAEELSIIGPLFSGIPVVFSRATGMIPLASYINKCLTLNPKSVWDRYGLDSTFVVLQYCLPELNGNPKLYSIELSMSDEFDENIVAGKNVSDTTVNGESAFRVHKNETVVSSAGISICSSLLALGASYVHSQAELTDDDRLFKEIADDCARFVAGKTSLEFVLKCAHIIDTSSDITSLRDGFIGVVAPVQAYYVALHMLSVFNYLNTKYEVGYSIDDLRKAYYLNTKYEIGYSIDDLRQALNLLRVYTNFDGKRWGFWSFIPAEPVTPDTITIADVARAVTLGKEVG